MNEIEIRLIGTTDQLARAVEIISEAYEIEYESGLYPCRKEPEKSRKYLKVSERGD